MSPLWHIAMPPGGGIQPIRYDQSGMQVKPDKTSHIEGPSLNRLAHIPSTKPQIDNRLTGPQHCGNLICPFGKPVLFDNPQLTTWNTFSGAFHPITVDLLRETYMLPHPAPFDLAGVLANSTWPWSKSLESAPAETTTAVIKAFRQFVEATGILSGYQIEREPFSFWSSRQY